jgi:hypothetical protein
LFWGGAHSAIFGGQRTLASPAHEDEGGSGAGQVVAVVFGADALAHLELGLLEGFVLVGAAAPLRVEKLHQLECFLVGHRPQRHHHRLRFGHFKRALRKRLSLRKLFLIGFEDREIVQNMSNGDAAGPGGFFKKICSVR